jgi:hypothetical protein
MTDYLLCGTFVTMSDGLILFHRPDTDWRDLDQTSLIPLTPTTFEHETVQELFITGLIEKLKDMKTEERPIFLRYAWLKTDRKYHYQYFNRLKYFEYYKIDQLDNKTQIYNFCKKYRD